MWGNNDHEVDIIITFTMLTWRLTENRYYNEDNYKKMGHNNMDRQEDRNVPTHHGLFTFVY